METPPGLGEMKLWMKLNDKLPTPDVINEVGDSGVLWDTIPQQRNTEDVTVSSGNPPYLNDAFDIHLVNVFYIIVPDSAALSITGDLTIAFTMYKNADANYEVLGKGITDGQRSYYVGAPDNGRILLYITADGTQLNREYCITDANAAVHGSWKRVVLTYDADGDGGNGFMRCYINSVEVAFQANKSGTLPSSIHDSTEDLYMAKWVNLQYFNGKFDNIMIDAKVWTQDNVDWDYNSGDGRENPFAQMLCFDKVFTFSKLQYKTREAVHKIQFADRLTTPRIQKASLKAGKSLCAE